MPTTSQYKQEQLTMVSRLGLVMATVDQLHELLHEENAKRYARSRETIRAAWVRLCDAGEKACMAMNEQPVARVKRAPKAKGAAVAVMDPPMCNDGLDRP